MEAQAKLTLGILGGGQLARMTALAAHRLGVRVAVVDKQAGSPAAQVTPLQWVADWDHPEALAPLVAASDVITLENEFIPVSTLAWLERQGRPVHPSARTLELIQDKLVQKQVLAKAGLPVPPFRPVNSLADAQECGRQFGFPWVLKARRNAYDGYGNRTVNSAQAAAPAMQELGFAPSGAGGRTLYAEPFVDFQGELATMVVRGVNGQSRVYPVVETQQQRHICKWVLAPARIPAGLARQVRELAQAAIEAVEGIGIFGVELFWTRSGQVLLNELAPRPHNSGHYSIEACVTSQFENHVRAVLGWPLGEPALRVPAAAMVNLLGRHDAPAGLAALPAALGLATAQVHWYGKGESRVGRKMGHVTVTGEDVEQCLRTALAADEAWAR